MPRPKPPFFGPRGLSFRSMTVLDDPLPATLQCQALCFSAFRFRRQFDSACYSQWDVHSNIFCVCRATLLRVLLGDFDFNYLATQYYPLPGTLFFLFYVVFLFFFIWNMFAVVMSGCFTAVRRDVAQRSKPFYLMDLLNKVNLASYPQRQWRRGLTK